MVLEFEQGSEMVSEGLVEVVVLVNGGEGLVGVEGVSHIVAMSHIVAIGHMIAMGEVFILTEHRSLNVAVSDFEFEFIEVDDGGLIEGDGLNEDLDLNGGEGFELFEEGVHFWVGFDSLEMFESEFVFDHLS
jgi:hypothetical protein